MPCAQVYDIDHPHWELQSDTPVQAKRKIGKTIKKGDFYVIYKETATGFEKEVELGLTAKAIKLRLNNTKHDPKKKVRPPPLHRALGLGPV